MKEKSIKIKDKSISKTRITKRMIVRSFVCFIIIFGILDLTIYMISQNQINSKKDTAGYIAAISFDKISVNMQMIETKIKTIIGFSIDIKGNITDFERAATSIIGNDNVSCVALAPNGIIQYAYPYAGNESLIGFDFQDSSIDTNNIEAFANDNNQIITTICGPHLFLNGKTYLIVKVPVLLENVDSTTQLWGYACAFIDFPKSLMNAGFNSLIEQKYNYKLYRNDINNIERIMLSFQQKNIKQGIIIHREVFNQTWNILIEPESGWYNKERYILESIVMLIISILSSIIILDYFRLKDTGKALTRFVNIDTLTGVFSRRYFFDYVEAEIGRNRRFGICYIDVDNFKQVNDQYGHEIGDKLLLEIGKRLQVCIRKNDFVARLGGDEFVIYMNDINDEFIGELILKRVLDAMEIPFEYKNIVLQNTLSIGYSIFPEDGSSIVELIQNADRYMYNMKKKNHREIKIKQIMKHNKINHSKN
ncbi:sensor domain-containing diguanylate cyclase [[Clostridium] fimetarium]|nr:sensor domain-containing diguanylate cyclase [[Clostridium] fimetarium]